MMQPAASGIIKVAAEALELLDARDVAGAEQVLIGAGAHGVASPSPVRPRLQAHADQLHQLCPGDAQPDWAGGWGRSKAASRASSAGGAPRSSGARRWLGQFLPERALLRGQLPGRVYRRCAPAGAHATPRRAQALAAHAQASAAHPGRDLHLHRAVQGGHAHGGSKRRLQGQGQVVEHVVVLDLEPGVRRQADLRVQVAGLAPPRPGLPWPASRMRWPSLMPGGMVTVRVLVCMVGRPPGPCTCSCREPVYGPPW